METTLSRLQIAQARLERAVQLLLDECDAVCAITLAGAAETVLGEFGKQRAASPNAVERSAKSMDELSRAAARERRDAGL